MKEEKKKWSFISSVIINYLLFQNDIEWSEFHDNAKNGKCCLNCLNESEVIKKIENQLDLLTFTITPKDRLYRAILARSDLYADILSRGLGLYSKKEEKGQLQTLLESETGKQQIFHFMVTMLCWKGEEALNEEYSKKLEKFVKGSFRGYPANKSLNPPADRVKAGRANKKEDNFLYAAFDIKTCIYEVRPIIGQDVSITEIAVKKNLQLIDLKKVINEQEKTFENAIDEKYKTSTRATMAAVISKAFSIPNYSDESDYKSTQLISKLIEKQKFDGIIYESSLNKGGRNVVIFYPEKCKSLKTDVKTVDNIKIDFSDFYEQVKGASNE